MKRLLHLCFLILPLATLAQKKEANAAFKGYKANYIYNFFKPASLQHPDGEVIGFRLDRKLESDAKWQTIQSFSTPATYDELAKNMQAAQNQVFEYRPESAYGVDEFWPIYEKTYQYDSIAVYLTQQPVAIAFKLLLADTNVNSAAAYKYRLVQIKKDNTEGNGYITTAVSPGFRYLAGKPKIKDRNLNGGSYRFVFKAKATAEIPEALLVKRKEEGSAKFERILPYYSIVQDRDSIIYTIADNKVREGALYQYTISPVNRYGGGAAIVSDTVSAFSMDQKMLIPKIFTATTDSIKNKTVLNWGFFRPELVSLTEVYRSENYETGYEYIGTSDKGVFVDQTAVTGKKYYYYLEITDQLGRTSERSTKIFGLVQSDKKPSVPIYVNLIKSKTGNVLSWKDYNEETRGFSVYRTNQLEGELIPISDFIFKNERQTGQYSFTDTSTNITGNIIGYAVVSENLSNVRSDFSKTLYLSPKAAIAITPLLLDVVKDKAAVHLFWQQNNLDRNTALGFNIYRKTGNTDFKK